MSASALHVVQPPSESGAPNLWRPIELYLDHMAMRVAGPEGLSKDNYLNLRRNLTRWGQAWSVVLPGGRHFLVPQFEERRQPLKFSAKDPGGAIVAAEAIAKLLPAQLKLVGGGEPLVRINGERLLSEASHDDLSRWLLANPQWSSGHTKDNNLRSILDCYRWYAEEFDGRCPFKRKKLPKFVKPPRRDATDREYIALMRHSGLIAGDDPLGPGRRVQGSARELRRALWCLYNLGIRTCEMRGMLWSDFNWQTGVVLTYQHKTARQTGKPRIVVLTPRQYRFFRNLFRQRPPWPDNVFLNTDGDPWNRHSFAKILRETARRLGLDEDAAARITGYCFRHSYATQSDEAGVKHEDAAMLMGHSPEVFEKIYSKAPSKVRHRRRVAREVEKGRRESRRRQDQGDLFPE